MCPVRRMVSFAVCSGLEKQVARLGRNLEMVAAGLLHAAGELLSRMLLRGIGSAPTRLLDDLAVATARRQCLLDPWSQQLGCASHRVRHCVTTRCQRCMVGLRRLLERAWRGPRLERVGSLLCTSTGSLWS